ncbi:MAG: DUF5074 domain-containing protein [Flavobacteriaceae bacterium]
MKLNTYFKNIIALAILALAVVACSNDDDFTPPPAFGTETQLDTLTVGASITLSPNLSYTQGLTFEWTIGEEVVGNTASYEFTPEERGDHEVKFTAINNGGTIFKTYKIHAYGAYENGFFIINEGWFGNGTGTVSFFRYDTQAVEDSVFVKNNPDKTLGTTTSPLEFGTFYNERLYLVSKAGGPVVVANAYSLVEENRIEAQSGNNWQAFVGVDDERGLLSSNDGVYPLSLSTLEVGPAVSGVSGQVGDIIKLGNYIFALSQTNGVVVLNASTLDVEKTIAGMAVGFAVTDDNKVWAAGGTTLVSIDATSLEVEEIELGFTAYGSWGAWHPGSITSDGENIYIAKNGAWSGGNEIYQYTGDETSLASAFATLPATKILYGSGIAFDRSKNVLVVNTVQEGWGANYSYNNLYFYNTYGGLAQSTAFSGYYFPAVTIFH